MAKSICRALADCPACRHVYPYGPLEPDLGRDRDRWRGGTRLVRRRPCRLVRRIRPTSDDSECRLSDHAECPSCDGTQVTAQRISVPWSTTCNGRPTPIQPQSSRSVARRRPTGPGRTSSCRRISGRQRPATGTPASRVSFSRRHPSPGRCPCPHPATSCWAGAPVTSARADGMNATSRCRWASRRPKPPWSAPAGGFRLPTIRAKYPGLAGQAAQADESRPGRWDQARSNRSRFITLFHAVTKSRTNFSPASWAA